MELGTVACPAFYLIAHEELIFNSAIRAPNRVEASTVISGQL